MCTDDDKVGTSPWNLGNDRWLVEGMGKLSDCNRGVRRSNTLNLVEKPGSSIGSIGTSVVSIVEAGFIVLAFGKSSTQVVTDSVSVFNQVC